MGHELATLPTALPDEVLARLAATRHKLRAVEVLLGAARATLALTIAIVVSFVLDKTLEPPLELRKPFAVFVFGSAAAVAGWFLLVPWRRRLDDDTVAVMVERAHPDLADVLVSAVQLSRALQGGDAGHNSRTLIGSVIDRAAERTRSIDFAATVDARPLAPAFLLTATAIGGLLLSAIAMPDIALAYVKRVVLWQDASYPKPIDLFLANKATPGEPLPREVALASGDDLTIEVKATRGASRIERIVSRTVFREESGRRRTEERSLLQYGEGQYRKDYQNVTESFDFVVDAGHRVVTPIYSVRVVARPRIEAAKFWLTCPEYTGIPSTPRQRPVSEPDLRVPVGTEVEYEATASAPLAEARLVFERDAPVGATKPGEPRPEALEETGPAPAIGGDGKDRGRKLAGKFTVTRTTRFRFAIKSTEGYDDGKKPVVFSITAVIDHPPEVKLPVPGRSKEATPRAVVPVEMLVTDDYEIASAELRVKVEGESTRPEETIKLPLGDQAPKTAAIKTKIDLGSMGVRPGDRVVYRGVAFDRNIDEKRRLGESPIYVIQVLGDQDIQRRIQDRLAVIKDQLLQAARIQKTTRDDAEAAIRPLSLKSKLEEADRQQLSRLDAEQRKVTSRLSSIAQDLAQIVEERELNRLGDQRELERTKDLRDAAKDLAERASPVVSRELEDTRKAPALDEKTKARLGTVPDLMDAVESAVRKLAESFDQFGTIDEIRRALTDELNNQKRQTRGIQTGIKAQGR